MFASTKKHNLYRQLRSCFIDTFDSWRSVAFSDSMLLLQQSAYTSSMSSQLGRTGTKHELAIRPNRHHTSSSAQPQACYDAHALEDFGRPHVIFSDGGVLNDLYPLQACKLVGGSEVVTLELLPQLVPLFLCPPDQRGAYGSSSPPAAPPAASSGPTQPIRLVCHQSHPTGLSLYAKRCRAQLSSQGPQVLLQVVAADLFLFYMQADAKLCRQAF